MKRRSGLKPIPKHRSDAAAERFVDAADLTQYDFSGFKPMHFELKRKEATVSMRMPQSMVDALKAQAKREGMPYQRLIRSILETAISRGKQRA